MTNAENQASAEGDAPATHSDPGRPEDDKRFFAYSPDIGANWYDTAEEAIEDCVLTIEGYREDAQFDGEWHGDVEDVYWGQVMGRAVAESDERGTDYRLESTDPQPKGT